MKIAPRITKLVSVHSIGLSLAAGLLACQAQSEKDNGRQPRTPGDETGRAEQAVTNWNAFTEADFSSETCDGDMRSEILQALAILRDQLVFNPDPMISCLKEAVFQGAFPGLPVMPQHAEAIVNELVRSAPVIPFTCTESSQWGVAFWTGTHIQLPPGIRSIPYYSTTWLAGTILHEVAHMFGFDHSMYFSTERRISIHDELDECSKQISNGASPPMPVHWNYARLADFAEEVALQPVGHNGSIAAYTLASERDYRSTCPNNHFAWGIAGHVSNRVHSVILPCSDAAEVENDTSPFVGDGVANFDARYCYPGELMVGLWGQAGSRVNSIGPVCAPTWEVQAGVTYNRYFDQTYGAENEEDARWDRVCPAGMAVRQVRGHFGTDDAGTSRAVNSIQVVCQSINHPQALDVSHGGGFTSESTKPWTSTECSGRGALGSLFLFWDPSSGISRISGMCRNYSGSGPSVRQLSDLYYMSGVGVGGTSGPPGFGETPGDFCAEGQVLVGLDVNMNPNIAPAIRGIRGICAVATDWANLWVGNVPTAATPTRGPNDGWFPGQWRCARGSFLSGVRVQGETQIENLETICRPF